jgi:putative ABC transport system substrate-binding protein
MRLAQEVAQSLRITVHPVEVGNVADFEQAFTKISRERFDGLVVYQDFVTASRSPQIIEFAARTKLPAMYQFRPWVDAGGLISYGTNLRGMYRRAGLQVAKILSGVKPADLPVEQPTTFELIVNMKTAKALGIDIPQSFLVLADQVIE